MTAIATTPKSEPHVEVSIDEVASVRLGRPRVAVCRVVALLVLLPAASLLAVAAWLAPDADGHGTHTQLGMEECVVLHSTGLPCATCGITTAFALAAGGRLIQSAITQPAGFVLCFLTAVAAVISGYAVVSGMWIGPAFAPLARLRTLAGLGTLVLLAWGYTAGRAWLGV